LKTSQPPTQFAAFKALKKLEDSNISDQQILQEELVDAVITDNLPEIKYLLEIEGAQDTSGEALETAIENDNFQVAKLLFEYGAKITPKALQFTQEKAKSGAKEWQNFLANIAPQKIVTPSITPRGTAKAATPVSSAKGIPVDYMSILENVAFAIRGDNIPAILANYQKLPTGPYTEEIARFLETTGIEKAILEALAVAKAETQVAFIKAEMKRLEPGLITEKQISQQALLNMVKNKQADPLLIVRFLRLEKENVKDILKKALEEAIEADNYDAAEVLVVSGEAEFSPKARNLAMAKGGRFQALAINPTGT
jgi:hypothetical protein